MSFTLTRRAVVTALLVLAAVVTVLIGTRAVARSGHAAGRTAVLANYAFEGSGLAPTNYAVEGS
jgi:hypothetical protein